MSNLCARPFLSIADSELGLLLQKAFVDLSKKVPYALYLVELVSAVRKSMRQFSPKTFADAHEFLQELLNAVSCNSCNIPLKISTHCSKCRVSRIEDEILFGVQVSVPEGNSPIKVKEGILQIFDECVIDDWKCPSCLNVGVGSRSSTTVSFPGLLIVHIKRFSWRSGSLVKLSNNIDCPSIPLDLSVLQNSLEYDLIATINHHGSVSSGHYSANVNIEGQWFVCDDRKTSITRREIVVSPDSYILFFQSSSV